MTLIITHWTGKLGNNILQCIRAIHYAIEKHHELILFPKHPFLNNQKINIFHDKKIPQKLIKNTFFNLKIFNLKDPEPYLMKIYFQKYIKPIFLTLKKVEKNDKNLFIHIRSGDIFSFNPHPYYVQPPLSFYKNIIKSKEWSNISVVSQDNLNPVIDELKKDTQIRFFSNDLYTDLSILSNSTNLVLGFGTFGLLIYFINTSLKNIYIPKYALEELPFGNWGETNIIPFELPGYIKCGEWKNTPEQRKLMLEYN